MVVKILEKKIKKLKKQIKNIKIMNKKQKKVVDFMIKWAEKEIKNEANEHSKRLHIESLSKDGIFAMNNVGDAIFYALQDAGYCYAYVNDAAYGGNINGKSAQVINAIEPYFKQYFANLS